MKSKFDREIDLLALTAEARAQTKALQKPRMPDELLAELKTARDRARSITFDPAVSHKVQSIASEQSLAALDAAIAAFNTAALAAAKKVKAGSASMPELAFLADAFPDMPMFRATLENEKAYRAEMASIRAGTHPKILEAKARLAELAKWDIRRVPHLSNAAHHDKPPAPVDEGEALLAAYEAKQGPEKNAFRDLHFDEIIAAEIARDERASLNQGRK